MTPEEIAALKAGDKITLEVEEAEPLRDGAVNVSFKGANSSQSNFLWPSVLTHATLTKAPPRPLEVGETVVFDGERWEVAAPPRTAENGDEVALWREDCGYRPAFVSSCTRVQP